MWPSPVIFEASDTSFADANSNEITQVRCIAGDSVLKWSCDAQVDSIGFCKKGAAALSLTSAPGNGVAQPLFYEQVTVKVEHPDVAAVPDGSDAIVLPLSRGVLGPSWADPENTSSENCHFRFLSSLP